MSKPHPLFVHLFELFLHFKLVQFISNSGLTIDKRPFLNVCSFFFQNLNVVILFNFPNFSYSSQKSYFFSVNINLSFILLIVFISISFFKKFFLFLVVIINYIVLGNQGIIHLSNALTQKR